MKKNFLVSTGLIDTWEFEENNFLLGRWCKFYEFDDLEEKKFKEKILMTNIIKNNSHHWEDNEKIIKDYEYIKKKLEYLLEIISEKLSTIHNVNESKEYWRIVICTWLNLYTTIIFDRWENIRIFFEKNKTEKFYSNFILLDDLDYIPINFNDFIDNSQKDEWNHLIFLRLFHFLTIPNLSLIKKKDTRDDIKKKINHTDIRKQLNLSESFSLVNRVISIIDNIISRFAFKFNKIIFESFYFPKKEYLKICLKCKLIPSKYSNIFDFNINENNLSQDNKRIKFKNLLSKVDTQDRFIKFLLQNLHKDIPRSYLENFDAIKKKILPF
jgi:putative transferase (TIGR04331 family)